MRKTLGVLILFLLSAVVVAYQPLSQAPSETRPLVFTHVTVIDATGGPAKPNMTVVITGDRITALGGASKVKIPKGAQVVDAAGKFLIPGLWDMHAHVAYRVAYKSFLSLLIANGVTGVRDPGTPPELINQTINQWRREIAAGALLGPRIVAAGPILDGPGTIKDFVAVSTEAEGQQAVDKVKQDGLDFVKVYSLLPREVYFAIADEARKQNIPFAGHVPFSVTVAEASNAGQKSIEHLTGMLLACSTREAELRKEMGQMPKANLISTWRAFERIEASSIQSYSEQTARLLFERLVKNGTWQCPTLTELRFRTLLDDPNFINDPRLKYIPPATRQLWNPNSNPALRLGAEDSAVDKKLYPKQLELVGAMRRAGVGILAGTDMPRPSVFPGFSLHEELELLVHAGLTPMQALQTATLNPARYLGQEKELGTVEVAKLADLVLLDANPLSDIRNTQKINAVVVNGRLLDRAKLDQMLAEVEAAANRKP